MAVRGWMQRVAVLAALATALALLDLGVKAALPTAPSHFHERSHGWTVVSVVLLLCALLLTRIPSRAVTVGAAVLSGGVTGNLLSARWNDSRVPNPLVLGDQVKGVAFNAADVFVLVGNLLLVGSLIVVAIRHRERLLPPRRWEAALRRRTRGGGRPRAAHGGIEHLPAPADDVGVAPAKENRRGGLPTRERRHPHGREEAEGGSEEDDHRREEAR